MKLIQEREPLNSRDYWNVVVENLQKPPSGGQNLALRSAKLCIYNEEIIWNLDLIFRQFRPNNIKYGRLGVVKLSQKKQFVHCHPQNAYLGSAVGIELTYISKSSWSVKHNTDPRCVITVPRWLIYTSPPHFDNQSSINWCGGWFGLSVGDCCHRGNTCFRVFHWKISSRLL